MPAQFRLEFREVADEQVGVFPAQVHQAQVEFPDLVDEGGFHFVLVAAEHAVSDLGIVVVDDPSFQGPAERPDEIQALFRQRGTGAGIGEAELFEQFVRGLEDYGEIGIETIQFRRRV